MHNSDIAEKYILKYKINPHTMAMQPDYSQGRQIPVVPKTISWVSTITLTYFKDVELEYIYRECFSMTGYFFCGLPHICLFVSSNLSRLLEYSDNKLSQILLQIANYNKRPEIVKAIKDMYSSETL